jgi:hypothetical protein
MIIRRNDFGKIEKLKKNSAKKIWFICNICGIGVLTEFRIYNKSNHLCRKCNAIKKWQDDEYRKKQKNSTRSQNKRKNINDIKKLCLQHGFEYISRKKSNNTTNRNTILTIICNKCENIHEKALPNLTSGAGCVKCVKIFSKQEREIGEYIKSLNFDIITNDRNLIKPFELDIIIPNKKIAIEYCGLYWHSEIQGKDKKYHLNKLNMCNEKGFRLITIFEDEWVNKQEIVKTRLNHILNTINDRIYARNCIINEISTKQANKFVETYHINGYSGSNIKLGAFFNNKLVAVMTFAKPSISKGRKDKNSRIWEIGRFCSYKPIIGIAGKFLKYFQKNYEWTEIFTFADRRWDTGDVYSKIGFTEIGNTVVNYWYFKNPDKIRFHRFNFRKNVLENKFESFDKNETEWENMKKNGWDRIWDCGNKKFIIKGVI